MATCRHDKEGFCLECLKIESYGKYGICSSCNEPDFPGHVHCPKCGSSPDHHELRNYNDMWRDGDIYCVACETYVRVYDAG